MSKIQNDLINSEHNTLLSKGKVNILINKVTQEWITLGAQIENPKKLFGSIWHEGEVGILFSNTGKGKSVLAVQIADSISKGNILLDGNPIDGMKTILFDFELSTKAFQMRYSSDLNKPYKFSQRFMRAEIDREKYADSTTLSHEELILASIKNTVIRDKPKVIIIDNITFLAAANEKSQEALALMKLILDLSRKNTLSILLIAHTPKRDIYRPIQLEDLAGSKSLSNFVDVCFCIGESVQGDSLRFIKQLKNRNYPIKFGSENVINSRIVKADSFLQFEFLDNGSESYHLKKTEADTRFEDVKELSRSGMSNVEIAKKYDVSEKTVRNWKKK